MAARRFWAVAALCGLGCSPTEIASVERSALSSSPPRPTTVNTREMSFRVTTVPYAACSVAPDGTSSDLKFAHFFYADVNGTIRFAVQSDGSISDLRLEVDCFTEEGTCSPTSRFNQET